MTVADLQRHLADLARLLSASGAKTVAADLAAIELGLAPFKELPLKGFADFLVRAEAFSRGEVPVALTGGRGAGGRKAAAKEPAADVAAVEREVLDLYARAADPTVTREAVEALAARLKPLKKDDLLRICEGIGLVGMKAKAKDKLVEAIPGRILARKGATLRAGLIDREPAAAGPLGEGHSGG